MNDFKKFVKENSEELYRKEKGKFLKWFETFLDEKDLPLKNWEIEGKDGTHFISSEVVIEHIKATSLPEQLAIQKIIVKIDFQNGDVNHFFKHLADGLVANY